MKKLVFIILLFGCSEEILLDVKNGFDMGGEFHSTPYGYYHYNHYGLNIALFSREYDTEIEKFYVNPDSLITGIAVNGFEESENYVGVYDILEGRGRGVIEIKIDKNQDGVDGTGKPFGISNFVLEITAKNNDRFTIKYTGIAESGEAIEGYFKGEFRKLR